MRVHFDDDGIQFRRYPFPPASVRRNRHLPFSAIRDVDPDAAPPEIRTVDGETLFVTAEQKDELRTACRAHGLPIMRRVDVWDLLLEPWLDTSFDGEHKNRTFQKLEECGISRREARRIRRRVAMTMFTYNIVLWEWVSLGLWDLLTAARRSPTWLAFRHRLSPRRYADFYWRAMEIADHGPSRLRLAAGGDAPCGSAPSGSSR